jgi:ScaI restriction endonuclease
MAESHSPYVGAAVGKWPSITAKLIEEHPLGTDEILESVLTAWTELHATQIGSRKLQIGKNIFPNPQIIGFLLHELIPVELAARHPEEWRREKEKGEKDLVYIPDARFSVEIKTSSHASQIFGNRSYAQQSSTGESSSKAKSGYFLTVNFQTNKEKGKAGKITRVRFGWLDHSDWIGQKSETGQQSRLNTDADRYKLKQIYP